MDLVVLSVGMEPSTGTRQVAKLAGVKPNKYGFVDAPGAPLTRLVPTAKRFLPAAPPSARPIWKTPCPRLQRRPEGVGLSAPASGWRVRAARTEAGSGRALPGPVVDTPRAQFRREIRQRAGDAELWAIAGELGLKAAAR